MDLKLKGKSVVISGGTLGIGSEAALGFLREGAKITVSSRHQESIDDFLKRAEAEGFKDVNAVIADASKEADMEMLAKSATEKFGKIDVWVNCAGGNIHKMLYELDIETFKTILDINLTTAFLTIRTAANYMMKNEDGGVIINISSLSAKVPGVKRVTYAAAKSGIEKLTIGAAAELAPYKIRVLAVAPGTTETRLTKYSLDGPAREKTLSTIPGRRPGKPEEVGLPIVCLASEIFGNTTGTTIEINGGQDSVEDMEKAWENYGI